MRGGTSKRETSLPADDGDSGPSALQDLPADSMADSALRGLRRATVVLATQGSRNTCPRDILSLSKIKPERSLSKFWPNLSKSAYVERNRLLTAIVIACIAVSLLGWVFPFTRDVIFRLIFTLLASFPLSVWFEREYTYRRRLKDIYERLETLQYQVAVILATLRVSPPAIRVPDGSTNDMSKEPIIGPGDRNAEHRVRRPRPDNELAIPTNPSQHSLSPLPTENPLRTQPHSANPPSRIRPASLPRPYISPLVPCQVQVPNIPGVSSHGNADPPHRRPPSSPHDAQRKPRSSNFFDRIKSTFSPRPASSSPPSHATTTP